MMSGKGINSEENKLLKVYENEIFELKDENKQLKQSVKKKAHDQQQQNENVQNPENIGDSSSFVDLILTTERSSPDGREIDDESLEHEYCGSGQNISNNNGSEGELDKHTFSVELEKDKDMLLENNKYVLVNSKDPI